MPRPSSSARIIAAGVISLALHGALLGWLVHRPPLDGIGAGVQDLEAVSIEVISAAALESLSARASTAAVGAAAPVSEAVGVDAPSQAESIAVAAGEPEPKPEANPPPPPDIVAKPDQGPEAADALVVAETPSPPSKTSVERKPEAQEPVEKPPTPIAATASEAQMASVTGGATSHAAAAESVESEAAAGASPGELARYALAVRLALGRTRPSHVGRKGKVVVSFRLSPDGTIEIAEIHRTSGSPAADRAALAAMHAATFPLPPAGSTAAQRSYIVPFDFK
ncbi:MAG: TonB family protein [Hyphomicrobiaceae bacterium]|nr:TonB family protein [Hyphomicrobiaceae bacterium]